MDINTGSHRAGEYVCVRRRSSYRLIIAKIEVYNPQSDSSYHVSFENAQHLTKTNQAKWQGAKRIVLGADNRIKVTWAPRQSGIDGPLVMQVVG